jgi:hypothetical protein
MGYTVAVFDIDFMNNKLRRFLMDSVGTAIFWTVVYTPIYLYTSRTLGFALIGLGLAALVEVLMGGIFGRYLDWFRKLA